MYMKINVHAHLPQNAEPILEINSKYLKNKNRTTIMLQIHIWREWKDRFTMMLQYERGRLWNVPSRCPEQLCHA